MLRLSGPRCPKCGMWINRSKSLKSVKIFTNVERRDEWCKKEVVYLF